MEIYIVSGEGTGSTLLSAFDTALSDAGVLNYNLIYLSSVIPPNSEIVHIDQFEPNPNDFGKRLYAVHAEIRSNNVGNYIGAAIGWLQYEDNRGLFVEHSVEADSEMQVNLLLKEKVESSLLDLCRNRGLTHTADEFNFSAKICKVETNTCALMLAVYKAEDW